MAMQDNDFNYLLPTTQNLNTSHILMNLNYNTTTIPFDVNAFTNPFSQLQELNMQSLYSTSDEADEQQQSLINERKRRRMISNRESARRSRMRKQRHLDELWLLVVGLRNENQLLMDKLNSFMETHDRVVQENTQLKGEVSGLREMVSANIIDCKDGCYVGNELSNHSVSSSSDLV